MFRLYKRLGVTFFGGFAAKDIFQKMGKDLQASGIRILLKTYVSIMLLSSVLAFVVALIGSIVILPLLALDALTALMLTLNIPIFAAFATFAVLYFYPTQKANGVRKSIDNDLPFAVSHMSAISSSGIPPEVMFELLVGFKEYKNISRQSALIVRNIHTFGMSSITAIKSVAQKTPSPAFKQVLNGITFTVEKGGNLPDYLKEMSDKHLFDYRIKREKYLKTLSTYADIYTALLVAAPLMMLAVLGILSVIGGEIIGFSIQELITLLTFVILPFLNVAFLAFIHLTYPGV